MCFAYMSVLSKDASLKRHILIFGGHLLFSENRQGTVCDLQWLGIQDGGLTEKRTLIEGVGSFTAHDIRGH